MCTKSHILYIAFILRQLIYCNAKTPISNVDKKHQINLIKKLNRCADIEKAIDIEELISILQYILLRQMEIAAQATAHNQDLLTKNGKMAMIPWDYNFCFGMLEDQVRIMILMKEMELIGYG